MHIYYGYCRNLQDSNTVTWKELEDMKKSAVKISKKVFIRECGENNCGASEYEQDPSFGYFKSVLKGMKVMYWQYAGFEYIWKEYLPWQ